MCELNLFHFKSEAHVSKMYSAVILQSEKKIIVPSVWVQYKYSSYPTKIFFSNNKNDAADFDKEIIYFFRDIPSCYYGYFLKEYGE